MIYRDRVPQSPSASAGSSRIPGLAKGEGRAVRGVVLVLHGGQADSTRPTSPMQLSVLRAAVLAWSLRRALRGTDMLVGRPRFQVRGWNGELASPVGDLTGWLDDLSARHGDLPVVLVGHSMGARAALRGAGHPLVTAVAGLAPWLPDSEPVTQLAGRSVRLMHGSADRITSPAQTWEYARRAQEVTPKVEAIQVPGGDHAMIRRARYWHKLTAQFVRAAFGASPPRPTPRRSARRA